MRLISLVILVVIVAAVVIFALQNEAEVDVYFLNYPVHTSLAKLAGAAYGLGMISGWTVIGLLRRSWSRVAGPVYQQPAAR